MNLYDAIFLKMPAKSHRLGTLPVNILNQVLDFAKYTSLLWNGSETKYEIWSYEEKRKFIDKHFPFKAPYYFVVTANDSLDDILSLGYVMEQVRLYLVTKDVSSFFIGLKKELAVTIEGQKKIVAVLAFGRVMIDPVQVEVKLKRLELSKLCVFKENVSNDMIVLLNAARLTPSFGNNQPWRFVVSNHRIHVFCKKDRFTTKMHLRYNYFDVGCMLSHLMVAGEEMWFNVEISKSDTIAVKELKNNYYMFSVLLSAQG